jgi:hypothetical protein
MAAFSTLAFQTFQLQLLAGGLWPETGFERFKHKHVQYHSHQGPNNAHFLEVFFYQPCPLVSFGARLKITPAENNKLVLSSSKKIFSE